MVKDSILNRFGFYAINFYDSIVNNTDNTLLTDYAYGDGIHLNNSGHALLYRQVVAKDIFNITTTRTRKSGNFTDRSVWDKGIIPGPGDSIAVLPGHVLTFNSSVQIRALSIASGATVMISSPSIQVQIGDHSLGNNSTLKFGNVFSTNESNNNNGFGGSLLMINTNPQDLSDNLIQSALLNVVF